MTEERKDTHTVSLMAEHEVNAGTDEHAFEDVILGTYPDLAIALKAAQDHVMVHPDAQACVTEALPLDDDFASWSHMKALVYREGALITEAF